MKKIKIFQKGFNFSQDGPGNRLVIHLQGCNMHCPWCSNPEGIAVNGSLMEKNALRDAACPFGAIVDGTVDRSVCGTCEMLNCASVFGGLNLSCIETDTQAVLRECLSCEPMFFDGGGVTLTGGEPTLQFDAVLELLTLLKANGIHTALETNASNPRLPDLFGLVDYLITDIKHYDSALHRRTVGVSNSVIIDNISRAAKERTQLLIRIPLIGGFNCRSGDEKKFGDLLENICTASCNVELLRYHEYGKNKWKSCGMEYTMDNAFVTDETYKKFRDELVFRGLNVIRT